jgi:CO/xanthine dehydrogenase FAD-binding subunit
MTEVLSPRTLKRLRSTVGGGTLIAGGTDLLVQMRAGKSHDRLIDISNLADGPPVVAESNGTLELSALAPITVVVRELNGRLPGIAQAARLFGSVQIRNRATIGGNLANASPAGDMYPPLVAANADAIVDGPNGSRVIPVAEVAIGPGRTSLAPGEWISRLAVPPTSGESGFIKLAGRSALAISIVSMAWRWNRSESGHLSDVRLSLGAVTPTVKRAVNAEAELNGNRPTQAVVDRATAALKAEIAPIDDIRASGWYRLEVAGEILRQAVESAA